MWKLLFCTYFAFFYFSLVYGAAYILLPQKKPAKYACEEGCYIPELDKVLSYKQVYSPLNGEHCTEYTCNEDGNTNVYTCGAIGFPDYCRKTPGNKSLPYPQCCDDVSCPPTEPSTNTAGLNPVESGQEPVEPVDPVPVDPVDPVPVDPVDPVPVDPVDPVPVDPVNPEPVESVNPEPNPPPAFTETVPVAVRTNNGPIYTLPVEPPKGIKSVDSAAAKPATGDFATSESEAENSIYHGPPQTLPVEPPVES